MVRAGFQQSFNCPADNKSGMISSSTVKPWTVLAHVDATSNLAPCELARVDRLTWADKSDAHVVVALRHSPSLFRRGPAWSGTRVLEVGERQTTVLSESPSSRPASADDMAEFVRDNAARFPAEHYALIVCGHGIARDSVGKMPLADLAEGLRASGQKLDVLVLDACGLGNLESLMPFADVARYAVVSEAPLKTGVIGWETIVHNLGTTPSADSFGDLAVVVAADNPQCTTVSVVNLEKLQPLRQALYPISPVDARRAARSCDRFDGGPDLGQMLQRLHATEALDRYQEAVVRHVPGRGCEQTTGLSVGLEIFQEHMVP